MIALLVALMLSACAPSAQNVGPVDPSRDSTGTAQPVGSGALAPVRGETRFFRGETAESLLWPQARVDKVYAIQNGRTVIFEEGRDWIQTVDGVKRTAKSRIPDFADYRYSTATPCQNALFSKACVRFAFDCVTRAPRCTSRKATSFSYASEPRNPASTNPWLVYYDYEAPLPPIKIAATPVRQQIRSIICLGDSIGAGIHTPSFETEGSDNESWCGLLRQHFGPGVTVTNLSVGGATADTMRSRYRDHQADADVVIVAAGMNDHLTGGRSLEAFRDELSGLVRDVQSRGSALILVGFFQQNELWDEEDTSRTRSFNAAIRDVAAKARVPFVDVMPAFEAATPRSKPFHHLTADYIHHPNPYGQRIYFSLLLPHLINTEITPATVQSYIVGPWSYASSGKAQS